MSYKHRPEFTAPDDQRCEALVRGHPTWSFDWMRVDHRCPKTANQIRGDVCVCHVHARARSVVRWRSDRLSVEPRSHP